MKKIGLIFPGQGSQYIGMGQDLYDHFPIARQTFAEAQKALGFDLATICFGGPEEKLKTNGHYPASGAYCFCGHVARNPK